MTKTIWRTIDFRPAPAGWRIVVPAESEPRGWYAVPLPGWLVQEEAEEDRTGERALVDVPPHDRRRRVVAAVHEGIDGEPVPADLVYDSCRPLGPGEPDPTDEDVARLRRRRDYIDRLQLAQGCLPCPNCGTAAVGCSWSQNPAAGRGDCCAECSHPREQS